MAFKSWVEGDLVKTDNYDGSTSYNTIEALEVSDKVNKSDLNRPIRNLYEGQKNIYDFTGKLSEFTTMKKGVLKDSLTNAFDFNEATDIFSITINPGTGDTTMYYTRIGPGIVYINNELSVIRPTTEIAERQLEEIFSLESWKNEKVTIYYFHTTDKFQARIKRKNTSGTTTNHDFVNGGTWGDSSDGYDTGLEMLAAIYGDTVNFRDEFKNAVGVDLTQITLEPVKQVSDGDSVYWIIRSTGEIESDTSTGDSIDLTLRYAVIANGDSYTTSTDPRTYIQNHNDFGQYVYLNVPQDWGDTDTYDISDPYQDTTVDYSKIINQNTLLTFLRKSTGDTQDSSIFGWYENTIPDIDQTKSQMFFSNKNLLLHFDLSGDTAGMRWVDIGKMSGDTWRFYGDKEFYNGYFHFNGDSVTFSSTKFNVSTTNLSFTVSQNGYIDVTGSGRFTTGDSLKLHSNSDRVSIYAGDSIYIKSNTNPITIESATAIILKSSGGDTIRLLTNGILDIDAPTFNWDGDSINFTASSVFNLTSTSDITLSSSADVHISGDTIDLGGNIDWDGDSANFTATTAITLYSPSTTINGGASSTVDIYGYITLSGDSIYLTSSGNITLANSGSHYIKLNTVNLLDFDGPLDWDGSSATLDSTGVISLDAGDTSNFTTSSGNLTIESTNGILNLTGNSSVNMTATTLDLNGNATLSGYLNVGDNTNAQLAYNSTVSGWSGTATDNGVTCSGSFAAYKVYNAVWNDYAEAFEFSRDELIVKPGYVYKQTENGLKRVSKRAEKGTIGVYSDTAGMILGSKDCITEDNPNGMKIPIGLAGKVKVYIAKKVKIGDMLVGTRSGFATKATLFDKIFRQDRIIGKVLEASKDDSIKRIWMLIV